MTILQASSVCVHGRLPLPSNDNILTNRKGIQGVDKVVGPASKTCHDEQDKNLPRIDSCY